MEFLSSSWEAIKSFGSTMYSNMLEPAISWVADAYTFICEKIIALYFLIVAFAVANPYAVYAGCAVIFMVLVSIIISIDFQHFKKVLKERRRKNAKYSVAVPASEMPGHGPIHRSVNAPDGIVTTVPGLPEVTTLYHNFQHAVKNYPRMPCLGFRPIADGKAGPYQWHSYSKVDEMARAFGAGLVHEGLLPEVNGGFKPFALYCKNRVEWVVAEQGLYMYNGTTVPLYDTLGEDSVAYILNQTEAAAVLVTEAEVSNILQWRKECRFLKAVIICSPISEELQAKCDAEHLKIYEFDQMMAIGEKKAVLIEVPKPGSIATFCYTSGTTGKAKGVQLSHQGFIASVAAAQIHGIKVAPGDCYLSYLPLAHVFERYVQAFMLHHGGSIGFYQGNILKITEDIGALRPHVFASVPRLLNKVHDKVMAGAMASPAKRVLFSAGLAAKKKGLANGQLRHAFWDKLVFGKVAKKIGLDRCNVVLTGSAPLSAHVMDFLRCVLGTTVMEGYGQTETSAAGTIGAMTDYTSGHVGAPIACNEIKLVSVPNMGYEPTDTKHGDLDCEGRGEICFRGPNCFMGYYQMRDKTKETLDTDGWVASGDIGIWLPNGNLKIVDRKKNIFKLAQGEYVAAEKVEMVYCKNDFIGQAFVYGDSFQSTLVAIFVPDMEYAEKWAKKEEPSVTLDEICSSEKFKEAIKKSIADTAAQEGLKGFEKVKEFHLFSELFSVDNGLLTPTFKLKRHEAKKVFQQQIDAMYEKLGSAAPQK